MNEQRGYTRFALWFPVLLKVDDRPEFQAICRDASGSGLLVSCAHPITQGTKVMLRFKIARDAESERTVNAEVVRTVMNDDDLVLAFPFRLGLRFEDPIPELPEELAKGLEPT